MRDETIGGREREIYELKKKNQELEKFKFVLDFKIKELKRQIEPREQEIKAMKSQVTQMDSALSQGPLLHKGAPTDALFCSVPRSLAAQSSSFFTSPTPRWT